MFNKEKNGKRAEKQKKTCLSLQQKILLAIAIILAIMLAVVVACQSLFVRPDLDKKRESGKEQDSQQTVEEIDYGEGIRPKADGERKSEDYYTVLIMGRDTGGGGNTDTMLLASYDVTNQKVTVMSIPRDTMVNVPWDVKKINSVYSWYGGGDDGIKAVYKEIAQLVGFEPDYQVVVEWDAIGEIVDAMGGVYFDVPREMKYKDPYQDLVIDVAAGYQLLSGEDAMGVIRWRHDNNGNGYANGDLGRIQTQQAFLQAVIKQLLQLKNVTKIGEFAEVFKNNVETDLSFQEMLWFGQKAVLGGLSVENITFTTMPNKLTSAYSPSISKIYGRDMYQSYVVPDANALLALVNDSLSPFVEKSALSDLDIMSVNRDGSVSSSTGYVEDKTAALPPVKIGTPTTEEPEETEEPAGEPLLDENGNPVIDPVTGEPVVVYPETEEPGVIVLPEGGETADTPAESPAQTPAETPSPQQEKPVEKPPAEPVTPVTPAAPAVPEAPEVPEEPTEEPGFIIMEPEPEM